MGKIVKIVVIVALLYLAWTKGLPFIQSYGFTVPGASGEINTEGWGCVRQAGDVRDLMAELLQEARPNEPVQFLDKLREEQREAEILCRCTQRGCADVQPALAITAEVIQQMSDPGRVGEAALQAARNLDKIDTYLDKAKAAARSK